MKRYKVIPTNKKKGKSHAVISPDGHIDYYGDPNLGQHPEDPKRAKAFYARHKKNIAHNLSFKAFAVATWGDPEYVEKVNKFDKLLTDIAGNKYATNNEKFNADLLKDELQTKFPDEFKKYCKFKKINPRAEIENMTGNK